MFINIHMCSMNEEGKVHNSNNCMKTDHLHTLLYRVKLWKYSDLNVVYMHASVSTQWRTQLCDKCENWFSW